MSRSGKQIHEEGGRDAGRGEETCQKLPLLGEPRTAAPRALQPTPGHLHFLSRGPKNEMISLGGPQLLSEEKHSAHFNIVLLYLNHMPVNKSRLQ